MTLMLQLERARPPAPEWGIQIMIQVRVAGRIRVRRLGHPGDDASVIPPPASRSLSPAVTVTGTSDGGSGALGHISKPGVLTSRMEFLSNLKHFLYCYLAHLGN